MKISVMSAGKPKHPLLKERLEEMVRRISGFIRVEFSYTKEDYPSYEKVRRVCGERATLIVLDEKGGQMNSVQFARFLEKSLNHSEDLCFFVGGPDGCSDDMKEKAKMLFSLSSLTLSRDLATLVLLESLYRSLSILHNHPYHRA